jgi:hypothetical protein
LCHLFFVFERMSADIKVALTRAILLYIFILLIWNQTSQFVAQFSSQLKTHILSPFLINPLHHFNLINVFV